MLLKVPENKLVRIFQIPTAIYLLFHKTVHDCHFHIEAFSSSMSELADGLPAFVSMLFGGTSPSNRYELCDLSNKRMTAKGMRAEAASLVWGLPLSLGSSSGLSSTP